MSLVVDHQPRMTGSAVRRHGRFVVGVDSVTPRICLQMY